MARQDLRFNDLLRKFIEKARAKRGAFSVGDLRAFFTASPKLKQETTKKKTRTTPAGVRVGPPGGGRELGGRSRGRRKATKPGVKPEKPKSEIKRGRKPPRPTLGKSGTRLRPQGGARGGLLRRRRTTRN